MTTIIVLFNLRADASAADYEAWARSTDLPTVNNLASVDNFEALKAASTLNGHAPSYQYVEILRISDMDQFSQDTSTDVMAAVAAEFQTFADNPEFIVTEAL